MAHFYYSKIFLDHLSEPRNVGIIEDADGDAISRAETAWCGDVVRMTVKIENDTIADVQYKVYGCAVVIASSSVLSELVKGKKVDFAKSITEENIIEVYGEIPNKKLGCVRVAVNALRDAVENSKE